MRRKNSSTVRLCKKAVDSLNGDRVFVFRTNTAVKDDPMKKICKNT